MGAELRFAWRALWKSPVTTLGAVIALALGIGATTAIFGLVNGVLLRPLPYPEPDRLVELVGTVQREEVERRGASFPDYFDWRDRSTSFEGMAAWFDTDVIVYGEGEPEQAIVEIVGGQYFRLLGVGALHGRVLQPSDDEPGAPPAAVIGERLWERRYGRSPDVLGRSIQVDSRVFSIVGVVPAAFRGRGDRAEAWMPVHTTVDARTLGQRGSRWFTAIARLRPGVTPAAAQAELDGLSRQLEQAYPDTNEKRAVEVALLPAEIFGDLDEAVTLLFGAVALLLLIACANVASLLLARGEARRREVSLRMALGASRRDLMRLALAESAWLVVLGAGAGWLLAGWTAPLLLALNPVDLPSFAAPAVDWRMLLFASGVGVVTAVGLSLAPLVRVAPDQLAHELREGAQETRGAGRSRSMQVIVVAEVAMAVALLVGATLLGRSFLGLLSFDPGFDPSRTLALSVQLPLEPRAVDAPPAPQPGASLALPMLEALTSVPGVERAALSSDVPLDGASAIFYTAEGQPPVDARNVPRAYIHRVTPGFFDAIGLELLDGRDFDATELGVDSTAVIVSEGVARRFWPGERAIGRRVKRGGVGSDAPWLTIVGVVRDANLRGIPRNPTADPDLYFPFNERARFFNVLLRTAGDPAGVAGAAGAAIRQVDGRTAVFDVRPLQALVDEELAMARFLSWLTGVFAFVAATLAVIGIYAVLAHAVRRRSHEIGIRAALGAGRSRLVSMVVGQALVLVGLGLAAGLALAAVGARAIEARLFEVDAIDLTSYAFVAGLIVVAALAASALPAARSVRVDPMDALRAE